MNCFPLAANLSGLGDYQEDVPTNEFPHQPRILPESRPHKASKEARCPCSWNWNKAALSYLSCENIYSWWVKHQHVLQCTTEPHQYSPVEHILHIKQQPWHLPNSYTYASQQVLGTKTPLVKDIYTHFRTDMKNINNIVSHYLKLCIITRLSMYFTSLCISNISIPLQTMIQNMSTIKDCRLGSNWPLQAELWLKTRMSQNTTTTRQSTCWDPKVLKLGNPSQWKTMQPKMMQITFFGKFESSFQNANTHWSCCKEVYNRIQQEEETVEQFDIRLTKIPLKCGYPWYQIDNRKA